MRSLVLFLCLVPSLSFGQSLADAAQKEKERRKKVDAQASPAPVLTNESLTNAKGQLATDPNKSGSPAPSTPDASAPGPKENETQWRQKVQAAKTRLDEAKKRYTAAQNRVVVPGRAGAPVQNAQNETAAAKANLDSAQKAMDDLMERARREGVPPGWLR
jgi:hypothetical protein